MHFTENLNHTPSKELRCNSVLTHLIATEINQISKGNNTQPNMQKKIAALVKLRRQNLVPHFRPGNHDVVRLCGCVIKSASVWLYKHSDEACSLASGFGVSFVWVFATANNLPNPMNNI